ncbi:MAG: ice-binding family protein [Archangium sp.]|nr:ice-binding family protein [Archangium sp.]
MHARNAGMTVFSLLAAALALVSASALAQTAPSLGQAGSFAVLGSTDVNNTGPSRLFGDLGVSPGSVITGFPPGILIGGTTHQTDAVAAQARADTTAAYLNLAGQVATADMSGIDLGGQNLVAGVYRYTSAALLNGTLTLDAQGNANAVFIFQIGSALTAASGSRVQVINGGSPCNVFWQVGSSATLNTTSAFQGNILALTDISLRTGATIAGRVLVRNGSATLDDNDITSCAAVCPAITVAPTTLPDATQNTAYSQSLSGSGGVAPYTFRVTSGALPAGLTLATNGTLSGSSTVFGTFNFTVTGSDANACTGAQAYSLVVISDGSTTGDPHMRTLDGLAYDLQTCGEFVLLRTAGSGLEVQVRQTKWLDTDSSVNTEVGMLIGGHSIRLTPLHRDCAANGNVGERCVQVDGHAVTFECAQGDGAEGCLQTAVIPGVGRLEHHVTVIAKAKQQLDSDVPCATSYTLAMLTGERVITCVHGRSSGGYLNVRTQISPSELGRTTGLMGNGDGDPTNDLDIGGGATLPLNTSLDVFNSRFGDNWRVPASQSMFDGPPAQCENHQFRFSDLDPALRDHAFATCRSLGIDVGNFDACAMDVALLGDDAAFAFVGMPAPRAVVTHLAAGIETISVDGITTLHTTQSINLPGAADALGPVEALDLGGEAAMGCACGSTGSGPMVFGMALAGLAMLAARRRRVACPQA